MSEFVEYLHEVFEEFGSIRSRRMFGGHGIYHDDLMFALVADDELYLKADDKSAENFTNLDLQQFAYQKNDKSMKMSYFMAPEEIFDDPNLALKWATLTFDAALRNKKKKLVKKTKK
jgi:DNA transformation protein and related proteins